MKSSFLFLSILMMSSAASQTLDQARAEIEKLIHATPGTFAVAAEDLSTGKQLLLNERETFHAASTMKTPVMIEVFKQAREGPLHLDDSVIVRNEFRSIVDGSRYSLDLGDDSDDSIYRRIGQKASVRELVEHMITLSSNLATNILIGLVNPDRVTATMRELGADSIRVLRGVEDSKAFQQGLNNTTTALDLLMVMKAIANGQAVDSSTSAEMVRILLNQKFNDKIPALLPKGVRVAHKTGNITGVEHDSGIVFLPDGRSYVIVTLSKDLPNAEQGKRVLAEISRIVYNALSR